MPLSGGAMKGMSVMKGMYAAVLGCISGQDLSTMTHTTPMDIPVAKGYAAIVWFLCAAMTIGATGGAVIE